MGLRLITPSGQIIVLQPFRRLQLKHRTVQLQCNLESHEHNLVYGKAVATRSVNRYSGMFIAEFSVLAFCEIAITGTDELTEFAKQVKKGRSLVFSSAKLSLDAEMHRCINLITQYEGEENIRKLFLYSKVIELLLLQQQSFIKANTVKPVYVKNEYDRERIVFARDYLLTHLDAPPNLNQLAAIAGLNEFKLKRGFKELFNDTVFGYLAEVRLEMARRALLQKQKTVTQIAFELGYASLQHFSAAFKKKFGVSPARFT
jgi:AraC family transcriptional activator of pyochelin receptor